jgi:toxin CcdB
MAQFDVHRNGGKLSEFIPFIVVIQSAAFDDSQRRVVAPLIHAKAFGKVHNARFNPSFSVAGHKVVLQPLEVVSVPKKSLGDSVVNLKVDGQKIVDALDELYSRAYG